MLQQCGGIQCSTYWPSARPRNEGTLEAYGDSKLAVNQIKGEYEVRHEDLVPYHHAVIEMTNLFDGFYIGHVSRSHNTKVDALTALTTMLALQSTPSITLRWQLDISFALNMC